MKEKIVSVSRNRKSLADAIAEINGLYAEAEALSKSAKEYAQKAIGIAFRCGKVLTDTKKLVAHGEWEEWCRQSLDFDLRTAQRYMGLYKKIEAQEQIEVSDDGSKTTHVSFLEKAKAKTLRQAYIATGILPDLPKPDNAGDKIKPMVVHVKHIDFVVKWYRKTTGIKSAKNWNFIEREALINDLTPLMEIYNELVDLQENSG